MNNTSLAAILLCFACASAFAQQAPTAQPPPDPWSGRIGLGYAAVTGNAKSNNIAADIAGKFDSAPWHYEGTAIAFRATSTDQATDLTSTTGERYALSSKLKYDFNEFDYLFGLVGYDRDLFSGYRWQVSSTAGYGRRVINTERQMFNFEVGGGAKQAELSDGTSQDEVVGRLAGEYTLKIGSTGEFGQKLAAEFGEDNTYLESVTRVTATLVGHIGLAVSYTVKNNSNVPPATQETDAYTTLTLQYRF